MSLVLDDLPRDPDRLLPMLQQMAEVIARQNAALIELRAEHDTVLAERGVAQAEIEKLRLLIRQAVAARSVRPPLGAARPRPAAARPRGPRADRRGGRGGARGGGCKEPHPTSVPSAATQSRRL